MRTEYDTLQIVPIVPLDTTIVHPGKNIPEDASIVTQINARPDVFAFGLTNIPNDPCGRRAVARHNLPAGFQLVMEYSPMWILHAKKRTTHCFCCGQAITPKTRLNILGSATSDLFACSETCKKASVTVATLYKSAEGPFLRLLGAHGIDGDLALPIMRALILESMSDTASLLPAAAKSTTSTTPAPAPEDIGFSSSCTSSNISNSSDSGSDDDSKTAAAAAAPDDSAAAAAEAAEAREVERLRRIQPIACATKNDLADLQAHGSDVDIEGNQAALRQLGESIANQVPRELMIPFLIPAPTTPETKYGKKSSGPPSPPISASSSSSSSSSAAAAASKVDARAFGRFFASIIATLNLNSHGLEIAEPPSIDVNKSMGLGLFPLCAMFNHSCFPNCAFVNNGSALVFRTVRPVQKGDELTVAYTQLDKSRATRRARLLQDRGFLCRCRRCRLAPSNELELKHFKEEWRLEAIRASSLSSSDACGILRSVSGVNEDISKFLVETFPSTGRAMMVAMNVVSASLAPQLLLASNKAKQAATTNTPAAASASAATAVKGGAVHAALDVINSNDESDDASSGTTRRRKGSSPEFKSAAPASSSVTDTNINNSNSDNALVTGSRTLAKVMAKQQSSNGAVTDDAAAAAAAAAAVKAERSVVDAWKLLQSKRVFTSTSSSSSSSSSSFSLSSSPEQDDAANADSKPIIRTSEEVAKQVASAYSIVERGLDAYAGMFGRSTPQTARKLLDLAMVQLRKDFCLGHEMMHETLTHAVDVAMVQKDNRAYMLLASMHEAIAEKVFPEAWSDMEERRIHLARALRDSEVECSKSAQESTRALAMQLRERRRVLVQKLIHGIRILRGEDSFMERYVTAEFEVNTK